MDSIPHILMMLESSRESGRRLISGVADYARHYGPWYFHWHPQGEVYRAQSHEVMHFDGVLVRDDVDVGPFLEAGIPAVTFTYSQHQRAGAGWVHTDDRGLSEVVAHHFLQRGFRNFAFFGCAERPWATFRGEGFAAVLGDAGFEVDSYFSSLAAQDGLDDEEVIRWLSMLPRPVALLAANDDLGRRVVELCREAGLRVPDDCAVVGIDNDPCVCGLSNPPLSSVAIDQHQSGYRAAALLDKMMSGKHPENLVVTANAGELVVRQSSDRVAVDDVAVAKAICFMQANASRPLSTDEVAAASGLYRRGLERRFKKCMFYTIQEYCRDIRVTHLEGILRESRQSLEEIAEQCGFSQASHLTRFYSSIRGESPSSYRKRMSNR